jgi:acyl-lipid omega-6 desaturase (Delta-12 desaturase)
MYESNFWRDKILPYTVKSDAIATRQVLLTVVPIVVLWIGYAHLVEASRFFAIPFAILIALFILRSFVMMHDCGHGSLFQSKRVNQILGFVFGVITGMPQYVWSKNHTYHHNTNGDWVRYGGVFNILSTEKYAQLSERQKRSYWLYRQPLTLIPAGFFYVLFNPRFNWIAGNLTMLAKIIRPLLSFDLSEAVRVATKWETKYWKGKKDYLHMTYNNVTLLSIWFIMCQVMGAGDFFILYVASTSLAGSIGILLFTIQHNFEDSYATDTARVNHYRAALDGTSMLVLPRALNWFTADIAYHHIHHLSVAIPNYRLAACHKDLEVFFANVKRVYGRDLLSTFKYQLWDPKEQKVVAKDTVSQTSSLELAQRADNRMTELPLVDRMN